MNHHDRSSGGTAIVAAVFLLLAVVAIALVGAGVGFFYLSASPAPAPPTAVSMKAATSAPIASSTPVRLAQFGLSELDIKDQVEAPSLAVTPAGHVLLAYASQTGPEERTLTLVRSTDGETFGEPKVFRKTKIFTSVSQSRGKEVKRPLRLMPKLAVGGGKVFLGWIEPNDDNTTVIYYVAESPDEGVTFGEPLRVHESEGARPNFLALTADQFGNVVATWLDHRAGIQQPFAAVKRAKDDAFEVEKQVYSSPNETGVCPCCPTEARIASDGQAYVAFRNQLEGHRDIYVGSLALDGGNEFSTPLRVVNEPTWKFDGCPHDGPSLAADSQFLYVAWMDASSGTPRCYYSSKPLGGGNFAPPQLLNPSSAAAEGNARLIFDGNRIIAVWEQTLGATAGPESTGEGVEEGHGHAAPSGSSSAIYMATSLRTYEPDGATLQWQSPQAVATAPGAFQTRPVLAARFGGPTYAAWNELDEQGKRVVAARIAP